MFAFFRAQGSFLQLSAESSVFSGTESRGPEGWEVKGWWFPEMPNWDALGLDARMAACQLKMPCLSVWSLVFSEQSWVQGQIDSDISPCQSIHLQEWQNQRVMILLESLEAVLVSSLLAFPEPTHTTTNRRN